MRTLRKHHTPTVTGGNIWTPSTYTQPRKRLQPEHIQALINTAVIGLGFLSTLIFFLAFLLTPEK